MSHLFRVLSSRIRKEKEKTPEPETVVEPREPAVTQEVDVEEPASKKIVITSSE